MANRIDLPTSASSPVAFQLPSSAMAATAYKVPALPVETRPNTGLPGDALFRRIGEHPAFSYTAATFQLIPIIITIIKVVDDVANIIDSRPRFHLDQDKSLGIFIMNLVTDLGRLAAYVLSTIQILITALNKCSQQVLTSMKIAGSVFVSIFALWDIGRQALFYNNARKVSNIVDNYFRAGDFSENSLIGACTAIAHDINLKETQNSLSEWSARFTLCSAHIQGRLGSPVFDCLQKITNPNTTHEDHLVAMREMKELLSTRKHSHMINIAISITSVVATILAIACPQVGVALIIIYLLWTLGGMLSFVEFVRLVHERERIIERRQFMKAMATDKSLEAIRLEEKQKREMDLQRCGRFIRFFVQIGDFWQAEIFPRICYARHLRLTKDQVDTLKAQAIAGHVGTHAQLARPKDFALAKEAMLKRMLDAPHHEITAEKIKRLPDTFFSSAIAATLPPEQEADLLGGGSAAA